MNAIPALVISVVGAGLQYKGQREQAQAQQQAARHRRSIADLNYVRSNTNANSQYYANLAALQSQQQQNALALRQSQINQVFAEQEFQARERNADTIRRQAASIAERGREEVRRTRGDHERLTGAQRARIAASGVTIEGSPIELLAETAGQMQLALQEIHYQSDIRAHELETQTEYEDYGAAMARAGNAYNYGFDLAAARIRSGALDIDGLTAKSQRDQAYAQSNINQMTQRSEAAGQVYKSQAIQNEALGNLLTSTAKIAGQAY